jgi:uncharacterized RDD family membrane protein YckC
MTALLPPGNYPPPPPGASYPPPRWVLPTEAYTPWFKRLLAFLIDWAPIWAVFVVPMIAVLITDGGDCFDAMYGSGSDYCTTSSSTIWMAASASRH